MAIYIYLFYPLPTSLTVFLQGYCVCHIYLLFVICVANIIIVYLCTQFLMWWLPILIVAAVGVVVGVAFLVIGCIFWVCRCCGRCGGGYSQKQSHDCMMCCTTLLLLLCTLGLL